MRDEEKNLRDKLATVSSGAGDDDDNEAHQERPSAPNFQSFESLQCNSNFQSSELNTTTSSSIKSPTAFVSAAIPVTDESDAALKSQATSTVERRPSELSSNRQSMTTSVKRNSLQSAVDGVCEGVNDAIQAGTAAIQTVNSEVTRAAALASESLAVLKGKDTSLDMVCQLTATREIALSIAKLYHEVLYSWYWHCSSISAAVYCSSISAAVYYYSSRILSMFTVLLLTVKGTGYYSSTEDVLVTLFS